MRARSAMLSMRVAGALAPWSKLMKAGFYRTAKARHVRHWARSLPGVVLGEGVRATRPSIYWVPRCLTRLRRPLAPAWASTLVRRRAALLLQVARGGPEPPRALVHCLNGGEDAGDQERR